mmetsp:Transcript_9696/g.17705  ORF Transcript_9696/g.17705 Transcript_9696/m.17705 type:complete len:182 (-) Transcript_9696:283-828(-)|eukprot:CAMPEP_0197519380 /NCGR_PEP_ID=MMETSP1318-20131121/4644_1 /TAXON_ID=552666 /ORGANISM="Partenskyella glossopodia, Strain RCC365" /LENGTH=181 /DNA_ID=CAMNT_0043070321 /DNA_START=92 /DNA_END=637 /DNA_ORIENTATION=-
MFSGIRKSFVASVRGSSRRLKLQRPLATHMQKEQKETHDLNLDILKIKNLSSIPDKQAVSVDVPRLAIQSHLYTHKRFMRSGTMPTKDAKDIQDDVVNLVITRRGNEVFAYVNRCPHMRLPLEWFPDRFMDEKDQYLQCSTHGALFEVDSGLCVEGPCMGKSLVSIPVHVDDEGEVCLLVV